MVRNSPIACGCDFYWLKFMAMVNFGFYRARNMIYCQMTRNPEPSASALFACNLQGIRLKHVCLRSDEFKLIAFAKFQIYLQTRENASAVRVERNIIGAYRLLFVKFIMLESDKCYDRNWLQTNTKCLLVKNSTFSLWIPFEVDQWRFTFVSVHFMTSKRIWPLHLITVRPMQLHRDCFCGNSMLIASIGIGAVICLGGLIIGLICSLFIKHRAKEDLPNKNT